MSGAVAVPPDWTCIRTRLRGSGAAPANDVGDGAARDGLTDVGVGESTDFATGWLRRAVGMFVSSVSGRFRTPPVAAALLSSMVVVAVAE